MPRSAKELREIISAKLDEAQAIVALAEKEDRDLTEEDNTQILALREECGEDGEKPTGLYAAMRRQEKIEAFIKKEPPAGPTISDKRLADPHADSKPQSIIPASANYRYNSLKAYDSDEDAYRAGQFFAATAFKSPKAAEWCKEHGIATQFHGAMTEGDNAAGGFTVPTQVESAIINLREQYGVFRREANVVPMATDTKTVPRRTGGVTVYFGSEGGSMTDSDKAWDQVSLTAKKLYVLTKYSSELAEDAVISIGDDLTQEIAIAFANKEDECGFNGDGTSTYGGMVGVLNAMAAGATYDAASGNTAFSTLDMNDFEGVVGALPVYAQANAKWYISKVGFYQSMARLADALGGNTVDHAAKGANQLQFLGYPVVLTQVTNATVAAQADTSILAFGDLRQGAMLGTRRGMSIMLSEHAYFTTDQIAIRGTERFDINVHETGSASAASSLVKMDTPSS